MIVIIDYGMGNLRSIQSKLGMLSIDAVISSDPLQIEKATKLILPGVGHFKTGMENLRARGLVPVLHEAVVDRKTPVMGICLGMQLLGLHSEEGDVSGLGWVSNRVLRFNFKEVSSRLRVPHVGWNDIQIKKSDCILFRDIPADRPFYFTHSYYMTSDDSEVIAATTEHGHEFVSVVQKGHIYGTQFHPEKSRRYGLKMIENFLRAKAC